MIQTSKTNKQVRFNTDCKLTFKQKIRPKPVFGKESEELERKRNKIALDRKFREDRKAAYQQTKSRYSEQYH